MLVGKCFVKFLQLKIAKYAFLEKPNEDNRFIGVNKSTSLRMFKTKLHDYLLESLHCF